MKPLTNKHILLGVTGGIAAYKSAELVRVLQKMGADVRVIMTTAATEFITTLTLQALSGHPVHQQLLSEESESGMGHIELARWADCLLVAPCTADTLSRFANGRSDDLLSACWRACNSLKAIAPAMNQIMWQDPATRNNVNVLRQMDVAVFGPGSGIQACGEDGPGRMLEPAELAQLCAGLFETGELSGLNVTVTAGPTYEDLDPVRFIGNRSTGKMGYCVAEAARDAGALVTLISGPTHLPDPERIETIRVRAARQMLTAVLEHTESMDIFISAAAVADYRPAEVVEQKMKKHNAELALPLVRNADILGTVAALDSPPFTVGFAAETQNVSEYAYSKLKKKKLKMIAANQVGVPGTGFESEDNALKVFWEGGEKHLPHQRKSQLAKALISLVAQIYHEKEGTSQNS